MAPIALSQILRGTRSLSAGAALRLGAYFGTGPVFWWKVQALCDLLKDEGNGSADGVEPCPAMAGLVAVIEEVAGPTGCWRSLTWRVRLQKPAREKSKVRKALPPPNQPATDVHRTRDKAPAKRNGPPAAEGSGHETPRAGQRRKGGSPIKEKGGMFSPNDQGRV
jgi:hypothetical protein